MIKGMIDQDKNAFLESTYETNLSEIDLTSFFQIFMRKRVFLFAFAAGGFIFSCIYALLIPPVWQGEFKMILGKNDSSKSSFSSIGSESLSQLKNFGFGDLVNKNNNLKSELEIIKSPYVLNSVFDFVKSKKKSENEDVSEYRFDDWVADHLRVEIQDETNILSFKYEDKNKDFIKQVLGKIIKKVQDYSIAFQEKSLKDQINFLEEQIMIHKLKTKESYNKLDRYSLENNLTVNENLQLSQESIRIKIRDEIYLIKQLLSSYKNQPDLKTLIFSLPNESTLLENFVQNLKNIDTINSEIAKLKTKYKPDTYPLKDLIQKKEILENIFLKDFYDFLNNKLLQLENTLNPLNEENEKIIKFKELVRDSKRNENTLNLLENAFQKISIEQSKYQEPWKLISNPKVSKRPIYPNKRFVALSGMLFSLLVGAILSIFIEYKSGKLYTKNNVLKHLPFKFIKEISLENIEQIKNLSENLELMVKYNLKKEEKINLIKVGKIDSTKISELVKNMNKFVKNELFLNSSLKNYEIKNSVNILLIENSSITRNEIIDFLENLKIINTNIEGFILIN